MMPALFLSDFFTYDQLEDYEAIYFGRDADDEDIELENTYD